MFTHIIRKWQPFLKIRSNYKIICVSNQRSGDFAVTGAIIWNNLPADLRLHSQSLLSFGNSTETVFVWAMSAPDEFCLSRAIQMFALLLLLLIAMYKHWMYVDLVDLCQSVSSVAFRQKFQINKQSDSLWLPYHAMPCTWCNWCASFSLFNSYAQWCSYIKPNNTEKGKSIPRIACCPGRACFWYGNSMSAKKSSTAGSGKWLLWLVCNCTHGQQLWQQ